MAAQKHNRYCKHKASRLLVGLTLLVGSAIGIMSFIGADSSYAKAGLSSLKEIKNKSSSGGASSSNQEHHSAAKPPPWFILHAGPPKSGTTTIQCDMGRYSKFLRMDNVAYIGRFGKKRFCPDVKRLQQRSSSNGDDDADPIMTNIPDWNTCLENAKTCKSKKVWKDFLSVLQHYKDEGNNVLMSDEGIIGRYLYDDPEVLQLLSDTLAGWRVKVVINYRRYYEWMASYYNTHFKYNGHRSHLYQDWPEDNGGGGQVIPTFPEFYRVHVQSDQSLLQEPEEAPKRAFESIAEEVHIFSMYQDGDFFTNFVCEILPTGEACNALVKEKGKMDKVNTKADIENSSVNNHDYDILAVAAYKAGLIDKTNKALTRSKVRRKIENYKESMGDEGKFPQTCLESSDLLSIFHRSLMNEQTLFPAWFSTRSSMAHMSEIHKEGFDSFVANRKFCSVNTSLVLNQGGDWISFFESLDNT